MPGFSTFRVGRRKSARRVRQPTGSRKDERQSELVDQSPGVHLGGERDGIAVHLSGAVEASEGRRRVDPRFRQRRPAVRRTSINQVSSHQIQLIEVRLESGIREESASAAGSDKEKTVHWPLR